MYWLRWTYQSHHDWPTGESGLGAFATMLFLTVGPLIAGILTGVVSLLRKEPRWLAITAIVVNAAVLLLGWGVVFLLIELDS